MKGEGTRFLPTARIDEAESGGGSGFRGLMVTVPPNTVSAAAPRLRRLSASRQPRATGIHRHVDSDGWKGKRESSPRARIG